MKSTVVLLAVGCLLSAASGQWLETMISLPDSFGTLEYPWASCYVPSNNCVYVAGEDGIMVIDAATNARVGRLDLPEPAQMVFDPQDDKIYITTFYGDGDTLFVVDPALQRVVSRLRIGGYPGLMCYSATANRLYCTVGQYGDSVAVIDCGTDSVLSRVRVGETDWDRSVMCFNPTGNKLYVTVYDTMDGVSVVDGAGDSLLRFLPVDYPRGLAYSTASNKLYCSMRYNNAVAVFDAGPDTLLRTLGVGEGPVTLGYNPLSNKVYCADWDSDSVHIIYCDDDRVLGAFFPGVWGLWQFVLDSADSRVFFVGQEYENIPAICAYGDTVVGNIVLYGYSELPSAACHSPQQNRLYIVNGDRDDVAVADAATCLVTGRIPLWYDPYWLCSIPRHDKVYCLDSRNSYLGVVDCATNQLLGTVATPAIRFGKPVYSSGSDRLYCAGKEGNDNVLIAVDCATDSVVATLALKRPPVALAYNPRSDRVYWADRHTDHSSVISVIDCHTNSLVGSIVLPDSHGFLGLTCDADSNRVYCASSRRDTIYISAIDGAGDTVTSTVNTGVRSSTIAADLCYVPASDVVCSTTGTSKVIVVDGAAKRVLGLLPTGRPATELLYNPLTDRLCCLVPDSSSLVVFDCRQMSREATVHLATRPARMAFDSIANRIYTTHPDYDCATVVDGGTYRLHGLVDAGDGPYGLAWSAQHRRMYVADRDGQTVAVLRDSTVVGLAGEQVCTAARSMATVVRGVLWLPPASSRKPQAASLMDVSGRSVLVLRPGANDVRGLAPGVYFVRVAQAQAQAQATRKVIITR